MIQQHLGYHFFNMLDSNPGPLPQKFAELQRSNQQNTVLCFTLQYNITNDCFLLVSKTAQEIAQKIIA